MLRATTACFFDISTFKSAPKLRCLVHFDFEICFAPQRRAFFHLSSSQDGSASAALASLLFGPPEPHIIGKTVFRDFPTFSRTWIFFLLTVSSLILFLLLFSSLLSSSLLFSDSSHLCYVMCIAKIIRQTSSNSWLGIPDSV